MTRVLVSLFAIGLISAALSTAAPPPAVPMVGDPIPSKMPKDSCVKPCYECAAECFVCMKHCRESKMEDVAKQCEVCHLICLTCANAVGSKNLRSWEACELCEKVCSDCAALCEKHDHPETKKCAEMCRACAKACAEARK